MLGFTIVNDQQLYLGIGIEFLIIVAIIMTLWAILRSGFSQKKTYSFEKKKSAFWQLLTVLTILIILFILNWKGYISGSVISF